MRRPAKTPPRLLSIPNRAAVLQAFGRACPYPVDLIDIELEREQTFDGGDVLVLTCFIRKPDARAQHKMSDTGTIDPKRLIGAAEILGQTMAMRARREINGRR